jgi:YesN/AraC family two-component response regulator
MRFELGRDLEGSGDSLGARFDHYIEVVKAQSGYRLEVVRTDLQAGFEIMALRLADRGLIDQKSLTGLSQSLERSSAEARTINDLTSVYRAMASDLAEAMQRPVPAQRERSVRRALEYIHRHYRQAVSFSDVAKEAGFAPNYFSALFKRSQGVTFERYLADLRLRHARHLLSSSKVGVARVAELSGFHSPQYFSATFRKAAGVTPLAYRERHAARPASGSALERKSRKKSATKRRR